MGFTTGFTGGVTLTLSLAYLSVLAHQRAREQQGQILRSQALVVEGLIDPFPPLPAPTRSEVAAAQRANAVEVAKDRWNHELVNGYRWVQNTDWVRVRENLEDRASRVWRGAFGGAVEGAEQVQQQVSPFVKEGVETLDKTSSQVATAAKDAFDKAKAEGKEAVGKAIAAAEGGVKQSLVTRTLNERFAKPEAKVNPTVADVLKERYTPIDKRDNSVLRGL